MRGIANAKQARTVPLPQAVDLHRQQLDLLPILQFLHAIAQKGGDLENAFSKHFQPTGLDFLKRAFLDDESGLEIIAAVDQDQRLAIIERAQDLFGVARPSAQPKPENIDRNPEFDHLKTGRLAGGRMAPVASHHQVRANLYGSGGRVDFDTFYATALDDQADCFLLHSKIEGW